MYWKRNRVFWFVLEKDHEVSLRGVDGEVLYETFRWDIQYGSWIHSVGHKKKSWRKKLINYQEIITKPWEWKYMSYGRWTMVFNNPDRESSFIYSVELFQDPSFFLWGEKQKTTIKKSKQNKKSNTTFSSNTVFNLISSSPFSFNSDNHSSQRKEAGMEFELNSKRISQ